MSATPERLASVAATAAMDALRKNRADAAADSAVTAHADAATASDSSEALTSDAAAAAEGATTASDSGSAPQLPALQGLDTLLGGVVTATTCSIDGTCD
ncbi:hypothetical protein [Gulosibacter sediminis]|uniref:hypothetical protein n=1 Tax=Gulosibacter sediminis TaxID=1729695 RepID=UPI0024ACD8E8|nr:hypothetical protein [Gulosibacter sediminis]